MKTKSRSIIICLLVISFIFTGCSSAAAPSTPVVEAQPAAEATEATKAPAPAETPAPTEAPPPLPCNITFETNRDGNREIYVMGPDGKNPVNLTNNPADDIRPAWSPDGSQIAFVSSRENEQGSGQFIYVMNADGSNLHLLTNNPTSDFVDWSHDGSKIIFIKGDDVYVVNADGSDEPINLTNSPAKDARPTWSPDGKNIAWTSDGNIFVMDSDGRNVLQLTQKGSLYNVEWTVDGQILTWTDNVTGMDNNTTSCKNCVMDADGKNITSGGGKGELKKYIPFYTVDGSRVECNGIAFPGGDSEIYLISEIYPDGLLNLTNNKAEDINPDWPENCTLNRKPLPEEAQTTSTLAGPLSPQAMTFGYVDSENRMPKPKEVELLKACDELKIKCIKSDSIKNLVGQKVNAILTFSNRFNVLGAFPDINEAAANGILLIVLDAETHVSGAYNLSIESDSVLSSLEWMFNEMGGAGEFAYFNFGENSTHQSLIDQVLKKYPDIKAKSMPANYDGNSITKEKIAALITTNPNLGAIWTDEWLTDIFWAVKDDQAKKRPAILCEPSEEYLQFWKGFTDYDPTFKCFSTIKPGGTTYEGVYVAYYILSGEKIDPAALGGSNGNTFIYDYPKITNDNLVEWLGKIGSFRKGDRDIILEIPPMTPAEIKEKWFLE
jgi:ABC-type sugar transport system substrate-binding protein